MKRRVQCQQLEKNQGKVHTIVQTVGRPLLWMIAQIRYRLAQSVVARILEDKALMAQVIAPVA